MNAGLQQVEIPTTNYSEDVMTILDQIPIGPEMITVGIVGSMIWLFVRALASENRSAWASFLVSVGIFGTFAGITIALFGFDAGFGTDAFRDSVPVLLGGMKIAFISSALGLLFNLILRYRGLNVSGTGSTEAKTADDIFLVMVEQTKQLEGLQGALVGSADSTLLTQLQLIRSEASDNSRMIKTSLDDFANTLAENNSAAFIEALEGAVREFNDKISQQFGENFAQLNDAVGRLLEWQEQYRLQLNSMIELFADIELRLKEASSEISDVAEQTQSLARVSEQQAQWLEAQKVAQVELEARLEAFSALAENAKSAFPVINKNLEDITKGVGDSVETMLGSMTAVVGRVESSAETLSEQVDSSLVGMRDQVLKSNELSQRAIRESIEELDQALGDALIKSLESLGGELASLSRQFVDDYSPLTDKLRDVVRIAEEHQA